MKFTAALPMLSLLAPFTLAVPKTRYSTVTIIPYPPLATIFHYHATGSFHPTGSLFSGYHNASANISLSHTLSYPTTGVLPTPLTFTKRPSPSSFLPKSSPCTPSELHCNNRTSFSLCVPDTAGGSKSVFMGAVANGTFCDGGRIGKVPGGPCSPVGNLKCQGERRFFVCDEGMFAVSIER